MPYRRHFLGTTLSAAALASLAGCATARATAHSRSRARHDGREEAAVTPGEDLMQEHGVLERILLVYDEAIRRIDAGESLDPAAVASAAELVRRFVEDYHEKLEEKFVFPRLRAERREEALVTILLEQHERGRQLTEQILRLAPSGATSELAALLRSFGRMYRPHAAREETVLFPAFREVIGGAAYRELGEQFEEEEHRRFGEHGFGGIVQAVAAIETSLGIADLASFTPPAP